MPRVIKLPGRRKPWRVIVPGVNGAPRTVRFFKSHDDAKLFASTVASGRDDTMLELMRLGQTDRARLLRCVTIAGGIGELEQAVTAWNASKPQTDKLLRDAAAECVQAKRSAGRSWQYVENLEIALNSLVESDPSRTVAAVTSHDIDAWLASHEWSASTRLTYLRRLETFWAWARNQGYSASDPTVGVERPTESPGRIAVLSCDESKRLLDACRRIDPDLLPYFAIGLFAGIRPDEIKRLTPDSIRSDHIEVAAARAKTRRRRLVDIHPTLRAWLDLGGEIGWRNWRRRWRAVRIAAGIPWQSDILRHTFCSYAYPIRGAAWTSMHAGHSETMLFRHYRELVTREDAERFWSIRPE